MKKYIISNRFASNSSNVGLYKAASIYTHWFCCSFILWRSNVDVESSLPMSSGLGDGEWLWPSTHRSVIISYCDYLRHFPSSTLSWLKYDNLNSFCRLFIWYQSRCHPATISFSSRTIWGEPWPKFRYSRQIISF